MVWRVEHCWQGYCNPEQGTADVDLHVILLCSTIGEFVTRWFCYNSHMDITTSMRKLRGGRQAWHLVMFYHTDSTTFPAQVAVDATLQWGIHLVLQNISQNISAARHAGINLNGNKYNGH